MKFTFGKYKGRTIEEVKELDIDYLCWMCSGKFNPKTKKMRVFVDDVFDAIHLSDTWKAFEMAEYWEWRAKYNVQCYETQVSSVGNNN